MIIINIMLHVNSEKNNNAILHRMLVVKMIIMHIMSSKHDNAMLHASSENDNTISHACASNISRFINSTIEIRTFYSFCSTSWRRGCRLH